ncbi:hypothetical protein [Bradyrhizobium monzae]|uniref:hypothetical protein n=1 Tax=Bradyrhizobium sp. Oc8 TaxID=2876780 RepID=UPI001F17E6E7|nr:hypothetical protein [Bradyrhizobium sp. Oc8]
MKKIVEHGDNPGAGSAGLTRHDPRKGDTLSRRGASELARQLQNHWHGRGYYAARFWAEPIVERFGKLGTHEVYRVACNLVNGLPPRYLDEELRRDKKVVSR